MKKKDLEKKLCIGIGNSAREDDGIGWAFLDKLKTTGFYNGEYLYKFQLSIEDAELISLYDQVIFIDASYKELGQGFSFTKCQPSPNDPFSSHDLSPQTVAFLSKSLYDHEPLSWLLAIQGYHWDLKEGISLKAQKNMNNALSYFEKFIGDPNIL